LESLSERLPEGINAERSTGSEWVPFRKVDKMTETKIAPLEKQIEKIAPLREKIFHLCDKFIWADSEAAILAAAANFLPLERLALAASILWKTADRTQRENFPKHFHEKLLRVNGFIETCLPATPDPDAVLRLWILYDENQDLESIASDLLVPGGANFMNEARQKLEETQCESQPN
jgi:hypothetical protein